MNDFKTKKGYRTIFEYFAIGVFFIIATILLCMLDDYLFHFLVELFIAIIMIITFIILSSTLEYTNNKSLTAIGVACGLIGAFEIVHIVIYNEIGIVSNTIQYMLGDSPSSYYMKSLAIVLIYLMYNEFVEKNLKLLSGIMTFLQL